MLEKGANGDRASKDNASWANGSDGMNGPFRTGLDWVIPSPGLRPGLTE